jgi:glycosyltransferase involved in cell wall biosynthesis
MVIGGLKVPVKVMGYRLFALHDYIVSNYLKKNYKEFDIVHVWPLGGVKTLTLAVQLELKTFLERPNSHTEYAFEVVQKECQKLNYTLPKNHSHYYNPTKLRREKCEYETTDKLLCPSQFVYDSFLKKGFPESKLALYHYGYDPEKFYPNDHLASQNRPFKALFMGSCEPRKGLHYALQAWLKSKANQTGELLICGSFIKGYRNIVNEYLKHPSIKEVGYVQDVRSILSDCDILVFPTIEEGSALVTYEARACGCVILVSNAAGAWGKHGYDLLMHNIGDVETLSSQIDLLYHDRELLRKIKKN